MTGVSGATVRGSGVIHSLTSVLPSRSWPDATTGRAGRSGTSVPRRPPCHDSTMAGIAVLGSTGSIGTQTLDVARHLGLRVRGLAAWRDADRLLAQAREFRPEVVSCAPEVADLHVALANTEAMVVAGPLMRGLAGAAGARSTPVDSEHSALYQCLLGEPRDAVAGLVLTASGGPFREGPADLSAVTPQQALRH